MRNDVLDFWEDLLEEPLGFKCSHQFLST